MRLIEVDEKDKKEEKPKSKKETKTKTKAKSKAKKEIASIIPIFFELKEMLLIKKKDVVFEISNLTGFTANGARCKPQTSEPWPSITSLQSFLFNFRISENWWA